MGVYRDFIEPLRHEDGTPFTTEEVVKALNNADSSVSEEASARSNADVDLGKKISTNTSNITDLSEKNTELQNSINELTESNAGLQAQINSLSNKVNNLPSGGDSSNLNFLDFSDYNNDYHSSLQILEVRDSVDLMTSGIYKFKNVYGDIKAIVVLSSDLNDECSIALPEILSINHTYLIELYLDWNTTTNSYAKIISDIPDVKSEIFYDSDYYNIDLNTLLDYGVYSVACDTDVSEDYNYPNGETFGSLSVMNGAFIGSEDTKSSKIQVFISQENYPNNDKVYFRTIWNGICYSWTELSIKGHTHTFDDIENLDNIENRLATTELKVQENANEISVLSDKIDNLSTDIEETLGDQLIYDADIPKISEYTDSNGLFNFDSIVARDAFVVYIDTLGYNYDPEAEFTANALYFNDEYKYMLSDVVEIGKYYKFEILIHVTNDVEGQNGEIIVSNVTPPSLKDKVEELNETIENKQDTLTFDETPTQNSTNLVTSGGIYNAIQSVNSTGVIVDPTPTEGSNNPVSSDGVAKELAGKKAFNQAKYVMSAESNSGSWIRIAKSLVSSGATSVNFTITRGYNDRPPECVLFNVSICNANNKCSVTQLSRVVADANVTYSNSIKIPKIRVISINNIEYIDVFYIDTNRNDVIITCDDGGKEYELNTSLEYSNPTEYTLLKEFEFSDEGIKADKVNGLDLVGEFEKKAPENHIHTLDDVSETLDKKIMTDYERDAIALLDNAIFNGGKFGVCDTPKTEYIKKVNIPTWSETEGEIIYVKFSQGLEKASNTTNEAKLSVNDGTEYPITYDGSDGMFFVDGDMSGGHILALLLDKENKKFIALNLKTPFAEYADTATFAIYDEHGYRIYNDYLRNNPASSTPYDTGRVWLNGAPIIRKDFCVVIKNSSAQYGRGIVYFSDIDSNLQDVTIISSQVYGSIGSEGSNYTGNQDWHPLTYDNTGIYFEELSEGVVNVGFDRIVVYGWVEYTTTTFISADDITKIFE